MANGLHVDGVHPERIHGTSNCTLPRAIVSCSYLSSRQFDPILVLQDGCRVLRMLPHANRNIKSLEL